MPPVAVGATLRGKYRVERILGAGGMGFVVAARQIELDRLVALKFMLPEMVVHPEVVERFQREARAASKLESPHVARVLDVDRLEDGTPFMVMEYLEGADLSVVRERGQPLGVQQAVGYILQAAAGLAEAHALGIIHRDVKAANLFLARQRDGTERVKVLDFGISKVAAGASDAGVTKTSAVMGSAEYMSPEQMRSSRDVDARTDIWALGIVLYELLAGRVPFPGDTITEVCAKVLTDNFPPLSTCRPDIPPGLDLVVRKCLARDRNVRFRTMEDLARALTPYSSAEPWRSGDAQTAMGPFPIDDRVRGGSAFAAGSVAVALQPNPQPRTAASPGATSISGTLVREPGDPTPVSPKRWPIAIATGGLVLVAALGAWRLGGAAGSSASPPPSPAPARGPTTAAAAPDATAAPTSSTPQVAPTVASLVPATSTTATTSATAAPLTPASQPTKATRPLVATPAAKPTGPRRTIE